MKSTEIAMKNTICREIVQQINNHGITDAQRLMIIYLLSIELENPQACSDLSIVARSFCEEAGCFVSDRAENV